MSSKSCFQSAVYISTPPVRSFPVLNILDSLLEQPLSRQACYSISSLLSLIAAERSMERFSILKCPPRLFLQSLLLCRSTYSYAVMVLMVSLGLAFHVHSQQRSRIEDPSSFGSFLFDLGCGSCHLTRLVDRILKGTGFTKEAQKAGVC